MMNRQDIYSRLQGTTHHSIFFRFVILVKSFSNMSCKITRRISLDTLKQDETIVTDIDNTLAEIKKKSSSDNGDQFQKIKRDEEKQNLSFNSDNTAHQLQLLNQQILSINRMIVHRVQMEAT